MNIKLTFEHEGRKRDITLDSRTIDYMLACMSLHSKKDEESEFEQLKNSLGHHTDRHMAHSVIDIRFDNIEDAQKTHEIAQKLKEMFTDLKI